MTGFPMRYVWKWKERRGFEAPKDLRIYFFLLGSLVELRYIREAPRGKIPSLNRLNHPCSVFVFLCWFSWSFSNLVSDSFFVYILAQVPVSD